MQCHANHFRFWRYVETFAANKCSNVLSIEAKTVLQVRILFINAHRMSSNMYRQCERKRERI